MCTLVRESNNPELTNALTEALAEARLDPADLFELRRSLSTMSRSYTLLLSENPGALDDVVGIELQPGDDIHAVAAEVERVFADIAKVWDRPDAPAEIRRLELTFPYDRFRPFVSGVGRLRREHDEAAEAIRPLLEPPPQ